MDNGIKWLLSIIIMILVTISEKGIPVKKLSWLDAVQFVVGSIILYNMAK